MNLHSVALGIVIIVLMAVPVVALRMILKAHKRTQIMNRITGKGRWDE